MLMARQDVNAASLSRKAGLNTRAVKDILEGRSVSPRLSSAVAIAGALDTTIERMIQKEDPHDVDPKLIDFFSQYSQQQQMTVLNALNCLSKPPE